MNKYHVYNVKNDEYICTLYTLTDFYNLQNYFETLGVNVYQRPLKLSNDQKRKIYQEGR